MTGWELLGYLADLADKDDTALDRQIYIKYYTPTKTCFKTLKDIKVVEDKVSKKRGIFIR